ncbi:hypothetical protein H4684_003200 [Desulfomicrobium macestii]|uniref:Uncharacterized protein n=2 Tax=Desulfomicrobium TaxID=898 RepID=A0A8G2C5M9_DESNO|nr:MULTISPECIES: hypothetical protein [Desulfomicrobium]MBE1426534.1 hypothetical protein [Desulfomicrobium macestii]SFM13849.1 hypothetical protein SAMN05421830_11610 [Desulfomicrobium norvegicum]
MKFPEYLDLFSRGGSVEVEVKFKSKKNISKVRMNPCEISKILSEDGEFLNKMEFDGYCLEIYKYEIDPINKKLMIKAQ